MATGLFNLKQVNQAISQGAWSGYIAPKWVEYLVVAGGGGGGSSNGGGGGAGGLLTGIVTVTTGTSYTVTVGSGGNGGSYISALPGYQGSNSVFGNITATGGGGGGTESASAPASSGGSGGGANYVQSLGTVFGQGISGQGNAGGKAVAGAISPYPAGGGGGAGTVGLNAVTPVSGNGGAGIASAITGTVVAYAGGGGGGCFSGSGGVAGSGGVGGGGAGSTGVATNGSANTGGGGGGSGNGTNSAGAGGSGIVVVRYPGSIQFFTGGTLSYANGYMIHTFYASGTLAPTTPTPYVTDYQISRSLRFNSADSTYLNRTPASASNQKTWTWSGWVKRSALSTNSTFFNAGSNGFVVRFNNPTDYLEIYNFSGGYQLQVITTQVFRDASAWYHIVIALDTTQATNTNRIKLYVNGSQVTAFGTATYPSQNADLLVNGANLHAIGVLNTIGQYYDGLITEVNFIDGQALTPSSFGYTNPATGVWSPLAFVGTYGTNGFYLNFSDNSNTTAATLGKDYSGNGNNWTPNNFSVTAGAGNDSLVDSPTSYGTDTGVGGEVRGNYCTLNPLDNQLVLSNGNLQFNRSVASWVSSRATIGMTSGKWYWEVTATAATGTLYCMVGVSLNSCTLNDYFGVSSAGWGYSAHDGYKYNAGGLAYGSTWVVNDVIGIAFDADAGTITFYKNNVSQGTAYTGLTSGPYFPTVALNGTVTAYINFGQRPFAYTAPSGYKALCTQNLPTPTIGATSTTLATQFFAPVLYTGNGSARSITGVGFQPDFTWIKARSIAYSHRLADSVRGAGKELYSDDTAAETTNSANGYVTSFNSDGFSLGTGIGVNANTQTFVAWNWRASNATAVTNTAGSITSTVSANTTSGFSVVTYTGTGSNATVGHGLGAVPKMMIVKGRSTAYNWRVYHVSTGNDGCTFLNTTAAYSSNSAIWNATTPTSTVFSIGTDVGVNESASTNVAYVFSEVAGYSKFGSYTGNGSSDGPFVFCGFRPAYFLAKNITDGGNWNLYDATRGPYNLDTPMIIPNSSAAEYSGGIDLLSNGIKIRTDDSPTGSNVNQSGKTYIFACFAQNPFKYSLAR